MTRFAVAAAAAVLLGCGSAYPQARMNVSPLAAFGMTSPLGVPNAPVGHTGIPLGATELATPGVSPTTSGAAPLFGATCASASPASAVMGSLTTTRSPMTGASAGIAGSTTATAGIASSTPGLSSGALFDGGGMTASAQGTCAASATASPPLAPSMGPGSPVGPAGIPLGSTDWRRRPQPSVRCAEPQSLGTCDKCADAARRHGRSLDSIAVRGAEHTPMFEHPEWRSDNLWSADHVRGALGRHSPGHASHRRLQLITRSAHPRSLRGGVSVLICCGTSSSGRISIPWSSGAAYERVASKIVRGYRKIE